MRTETLKTSAKDAIALATKILGAGGLIAFPTDTVYGLAARVYDQTGIDKLYEVKGRDSTKAIAVLIGSLDQLKQVAADFTPSARILAEKFWPGALTLVVPRCADLPENLSQYPTVGIRMPALEFARALINITGPLATTSANLSGGQNPVSAADVDSQLGGLIELILDGGSTPGPIPSTVVDCSQPRPKIFRHGMITADDIAAALDIHPEELLNK